jgi:3-dehydroquinate dehydratase
VKIVTTARNISDAARTMRLYDLQADGALFEGAAAAERPQLVAFSMGEAGKFTRLLCLSWMMKSLQKKKCFIISRAIPEWQKVEAEMF